MSKELSVHKVTLSTGKVVLIRELKIKHQELAMKAASGKGSSDNQMLFATQVQNELLKILIYSVNGKALTDIEKADLDSIFSFAEYTQVMKALGKITNTDGDSGEFQLALEIITSK